MIDYFALLEQPRRPWLDPEVIKEKFLSLSANLHPDRTHTSGDADRQQAQQRYSDLNAACQCLRETKSRLRHLLELERGTPATDLQRIPSDLMDLSLTIGQLCREADAVIAKNSGITSPLLKAQAFERNQEFIGRLQELQRNIQTRQATLDDALKGLDRQWPVMGDGAKAFSRLEELSHLYGYLNRWNSQIQERIVRLAF